MWECDVEAGDVEEDPESNVDVDLWSMIIETGERAREEVCEADAPGLPLFLALQMSARAQLLLWQSDCQIARR